MKKIPNINARDFAIILDLDPYMTSYELLENKVENKHPFFGNKFTDHGIKYERIALNMFEKETNNIVDDKQSNIKHSQYSWITGRVDGVLKNEKYIDENKHKKRKINYKIVEVKCPYKLDRDKNIYLTEDTMPKHYWAQCQVYMEMMNIDETIYIEFYIKPDASEDSGKLYYTTVKRDKQWWEDSLPKIQLFYEEMVKYCNIGSLETHPIRIAENIWKNNLFSKIMV